MLRRPLLPARPPPAFTRTTPGGRSSSSCTHDQLRRLGEPVAASSAGRTAWPLSFMYVSGNASTTRSPRTRASATVAWSRPGFSSTPAPLGEHRRSDVLADVVARAGVLLAGVAETDDQSLDGHVRMPIGSGRLRSARWLVRPEADVTRRQRRRRQPRRPRRRPQRRLRCWRGSEDGDDRHVGVADGGDALRHRQVGQADDVVRAACR